MIIPKPIITQLNLTIIVLSLVFKRTLEVLFGKALSGVAIEVLFAFPYQFTFLVVGFYGVPKWYYNPLNSLIIFLYDSISISVDLVNYQENKG